MSWPENLLWARRSLLLLNTRAVLVFATEHKNNVDPCLKVNNNKVMCHLSMKHPDMFDPNPMYTSDKIVVKHISVEETVLSLALSPKIKVIAKNGNTHKYIIILNKQSRDLLSNCCATDESNRL